MSLESPSLGHFRDRRLDKGGRCFSNAWLRARLLEGEAMTDVCRSFGISRKTGYKIFNRYKEQGVEALCDRSRRPVRYANQLPCQIESLIIGIKRDKPHWGARKIRQLLEQRASKWTRTVAL